MLHISPMKILVVEDDNVSAIGTCRLLQKNGHQAHRAKNGREALNRLDSEFYDIVLMDIQMPELDGLEATRRIRTSEKPTSSIPIVAVSANPNPPASDMCQEAGMDEFIAKPFSIPVFEQALWQMQNQRAFSRE